MKTMKLKSETSLFIDKPDDMIIDHPNQNDILFFDLETQKSSDEVGGWSNIRDMLVSVAVFIDLNSDDYQVYYEDDIDELICRLFQAKLVVGFNLKHFDYQVLEHYTDRDFSKINTFDILADIHNRIGHRIKLDNLAENNLGNNKSADGLQAIKWFKEGDIDKIARYCCIDVQITRDIFRYGIINKHLNYMSKYHGDKTVDIDWDLFEIVPIDENKDVSHLF